LTPNQEHILSLAQRGERAAQHQLYQLFAPRVFGVCLRYASDEQQADDMAQDAWIRAFHKLDSFRGEGSFDGWLRRLTVHCCLQFLRKQKLPIDDGAAERLAHGDHPLPSALQVEATAVQQLTAEELLNYIQELPEGFRVVFNLVAIEGYSHAEAAKMLGISESTSRSQLTRARTKLQESLSKLFALCL
jgi:RNA polymerase sigma-70 factor (ECF subfamily)